MKARGFPPRIKVILRKSKNRGARGTLELARGVHFSLSSNPLALPTAVLSLEQFGADVDALSAGHYMRVATSLALER